MTSLQVRLDSIPSCPGNDDYDHSVRIATNEQEQDKTLDFLAREPIRGNAVIGVSGFFLLNVVGLRATNSTGEPGSIDTIILIDRSLRVAHFWNQMQPIITGSSNRLEVIGKVRELIRRHSENYFGGGKEPHFVHCCIEERLFSRELETQLSWLSSEAQFRRVQRIFNNQGFVFKLLDFCDLEAFTKLGQIFKERQISIDTAYISNCVEFLIPEPEQLYYYRCALEQIIEAETHVIHTSRSLFHTHAFGQTYRLCQIVTQKKNETIAKLLCFSPIVKDERLENGDPAPGSIKLNLLAYAHLEGKL